MLFAKGKHIPFLSALRPFFCNRKLKRAIFAYPNPAGKSAMFRVGDCVDQVIIIYWRDQVALSKGSVIFNVVPSPPLLTT